MLAINIDRLSVVEPTDEIIGLNEVVGIFTIGRAWNFEITLLYLILTWIHSSCDVCALYLGLAYKLLDLFWTVRRGSVLCCT